MGRPGRRCGNCAAVTAGQTITVNYIGLTLSDGTVFDSSWPRRRTFEVQIGFGQLGRDPQVIEGPFQPRC